MVYTSVGCQPRSNCVIESIISCKYIMSRVEEKKDKGVPLHTNFSYPQINKNNTKEGQYKKSQICLIAYELPSHSQLCDFNIMEKNSMQEIEKKKEK